ncbi:hypothetical protein [Comamonas sp. A7-5]
MSALDLAFALLGLGMVACNSFVGFCFVAFLWVITRFPVVA